MTGIKVNNTDTLTSYDPFYLAYSGKNIVLKVLWSLEIDGRSSHLKEVHEIEKFSR